MCSTNIAKNCPERLARRRAAFRLQCIATLTTMAAVQIVQKMKSVYWNITVKTFADETHHLHFADRTDVIDVNINENVEWNTYNTRQNITCYDTLTTIEKRIFVCYKIADRSLWKISKKRHHNYVKKGLTVVKLLWEMHESGTGNRVEGLCVPHHWQIGNRVGHNPSCVHIKGPYIVATRHVSWVQFKISQKCRCTLALPRSPLEKLTAGSHKIGEEFVTDGPAVDRGVRAIAPEEPVFHQLNFCEAKIVIQIELWRKLSKFPM